MGTLIMIECIYLIIICFGCISTCGILPDLSTFDGENSVLGKFWADPMFRQTVGLSVLETQWTFGTSSEPRNVCRTNDTMEELFFEARKHQGIDES